MANPKRSVYIGPGSDQVVADALEHAGARITPDPQSADTIVWLSPSMPDLRAVLHPGITWVQLKSAGVDHVLASGLIDQDRHWTGAGGAYADAVAEHGLALMLAAGRRFHDIIGHPTWGEPQTRFGRVLMGSTVTIVGCGAIGESLIRFLEPFDVQVLAVTRSGRSVPGAAESLGSEGADAAIGQADFVVLTAPATPETVGFMGRSRLSLMRPDAWLVNVGRGNLVVTEDLVAALEERTIGGAALDVTDPEPLPDGHPLWSAPNVLITPHTANPPETNSQTLAKRALDNMHRLSSGEPLLGVIDPDRGY